MTQESLFEEFSKKRRTLFFEVFRYNLVPHIQSPEKQEAIFDIKTIEDLKQKAIESKNKYFEELLLTVLPDINPQTSRLSFQLKANNNSVFLFRIGHRKDAILQDYKFNEKREENWEDIFVIFDNHPERQYIYVQKNTVAFRETTEAINKLRSLFNQILKRVQLIIEINPVPKQRRFWEIVQRHPLAVKKVEFKLSAPNLPQLSQFLSEELKDLARTTTASNVKLSLESENAGALSLDQQRDLNLNGIVQYVENGGGTASILIKGYKKMNLTAEGQITTVSIDSLEIERATNQDIEDLIGKLHE